MDDLDDLLVQLEKSSNDLKKQGQSSSPGNNSNTKTKYSSSSRKLYEAEPVEVSSTRWTTTTSTSQQNGNDNVRNSSTSPTAYTADVVDQARRLPASNNRRAATVNQSQPTTNQNGYSSVEKSSAKSRADATAAVAEREPVIYPHNQVVPVITSYREHHKAGQQQPVSNNQYAAEREYSPYSDKSGRRREERNVDTGRPANRPSAAAATRNTSSTGGAPPSTATRALDELMQSFGSLHNSSSGNAAATRERRSPSAEGSRTVPRPYVELTETEANDLSEIEFAQTSDAAGLSDKRTAKSPTPPRDQLRAGQQQPPGQLRPLPTGNSLPYAQQQVDYTYQPIERSGKGTSVSYNDSRYQSSPAERSASRDRTSPVELNASRSSRLRSADHQRSPPPIASYERIQVTTTRTTTPDDNDENRRKPFGGVSVLPTATQPTGILKRSPTPVRETVNRRIAGVNTENTTAFGDVGRPRSVALSDNEGGDGDEYESVREYKYERRETTTTETTETKQDEIDASRARNTTKESEKPTPRARTNRPHVAESSTTTTNRFTSSTQREPDTPSPSLLQPASILRNSTLQGSGSKVCSECGKPGATIYDAVGRGTPDPDNPLVTALGRLWHMQCFACSACGAVLNNVPFYERQQKLWCEADYLQHFSPKCAQCAKPIIGQCVTALGSQQFHPDCFRCYDCKKPLLGTGGAGAGGYAEDKGTALCNVCYDERYGKKCKGCSSTIRGGTSYVESNGAAWHDECFRCHMCNDPINRGAGGAAAMHELDGKPVCERDYYGRFGATCAACQQPILGRCITAMGKKFHPDHFCCAFCKRVLDRGLFKELEGVPWCHPCWGKIFCNEEQVFIEQPATRAMPLAPLAELNRNSPSRF